MDPPADEPSAARFVAELAGALLVVDPLGVAEFDRSGDDYRPVARRIGARLAEARAAGDLARILHEELTAAFGLATAGQRTRYHGIARAIWRRWTACMTDDGPPSSAASA